MSERLLQHGDHRQLIRATWRCSLASWARLLTTPLLCLVSLVTIAYAQELPTSDEWQPAVPSPAALSNGAVRAALERPRDTPSDYLRATLNLLDLGEPALARNAFHELNELGLDDAAKAKLVAEFGPAAMLRISREPKLGPNVGAFVDSAMASSATEAASTERIEKLISQLGSDNTSSQSNAVAALAAIGQPAVVPLIQTLGNQATTEQQCQGARAALLRLGPLADRPLLATLESGDDQLVSEAATLLADLESTHAAPLMALRAVQSSSGSAVEQAYRELTGQHPTIESVTGLLERTIKNTEGGAPVFEADADDQVAYWVWGAKPVNDQKPFALTLSVADANLLYRADLVAQLAELRPGLPRLDSKALRLAIERVDILGRSDLAVGYPAEKIGGLSAQWLNQLLSDALEENQVASATLALEVIADRRDPGMLITHNGTPSPTALALEHPHPSIVVAALKAVAAIDSPTPFPGASKVCPAIVRLATATGQNLVLAGAPQLDVAASWSGGLASLDFNGQIAATGEQLIDLARMRADVELVLIDTSIGRPAVRDVVYQLRSQPSTGLVPIGLFARESQLAAARRIASEHTRVLAFPRPHTDEALTGAAEQLLPHLPVNWPTADERLAYADTAIAVMNQLLGEDRDFYRLRAASAMIARSIHPNTSSAAAWDLLSRLGTRDSQVALLANASAPALDIETRRAAGAAFDKSVKQFGLRLTSGEIVRQYDLYNASETADREEQQVLGSLLDTIEAGREQHNDEPR